MTSIFRFAAVFPMIFLASIACSQPRSGEIQFDCYFNKVGASSKDIDAKEWYESDILKRMTFTAILDPIQVTEAPGRSEFWGLAQIETTSQKVTFSWRLKAKPLNRSPELRIIVDRFSGEAIQGYSLLSAPNKGPLEVHWTRAGSCTFNQRKI